ncbi:MAG: geranylgeranyl reductase family protein [Candidatus Levyibacteriota bacterium]
MSAVEIDVRCAGLGPAGARAAAAAARRGARVLAVDRKREPGRPVQCAEFVPALIGSNVSGLARSVRQSIRAMETYVEGETPDLTDPFPGQMLDRAAFDAALVEEAIAAGASCRFATTLRAVDRDGSVELSDGTRLRARVLIGADGPRSVVGRAIGSVNRRLVETRQVTVPLRKAHDATDIFLSAATPGGYAWLFPKGEIANVGAGVDPAHKGALKGIVDDLHASLVAAGRVGREILARTGGAIPVGGMVKATGTLGATQVLLAGDAAGLANPITGAGITAAVHSGALAGEAAAEALRGNPDALSDYEDELDALFAVALSRAVRRREELASAMETHTLPRNAALRRGWVAYPDYWAP